MTMMMFRKPSNTAPCARKWSLAPTTPSETRSSVKRTTWWVSHICFLFFDHHDNMVSFSYMFLCSMILCDNHRHHDAPSRRTWRNVESVEPRSKARRFGQPEAFTMLNASNVKSASKTIIFKTSVEKHLSFHHFTTDSGFSTNPIKPEPRCSLCDMTFSTDDQNRLYCPQVNKPPSSSSSSSSSSSPSPPSWSRSTFRITRRGLRLTAVSANLQLSQKRDKRRCDDDYDCDHGDREYAGMER